MAERTLSLLSRTAASAKPTILKTGKPKEISTSTSTTMASKPLTAQDCIFAIMFHLKKYKDKGLNLNEIEPAEITFFYQNFLLNQRFFSFVLLCILKSDIYSTIFEYAFVKHYIIYD